VIVGAGLAGLITAHAFPNEAIIEVQPEPESIHKALLRFRTPSVGEMTGIEFKPVNVRKGIWFHGFEAPNIRNANLYSQKVLGRLADRSIWNLDPVTRYIAPMDFYERLIDSVKDRITWGTDWSAQDDPFDFEPIISTAPLKVMLDHFNIDTGEEFHRAPISVERYTVPNADVYQTIYFPTTQHSLYRASITGDLLICEFAGNPAGDWTSEMFAAFGLHRDDKVELIDSGTQNYGKIAEIDEKKRRAAIARLTMEHNIFSVGRFATWRNILLDDVVHDIAVVKRLMNATAYERRLAL